MRILNILQWILNCKSVRIQRKLLYILCDAIRNTSWVKWFFQYPVANFRFFVEMNIISQSNLARHNTKVRCCMLYHLDQTHTTDHTTRRNICLIDIAHTAGDATTKAPHPHLTLRECLSSGQQITSRYVRINGDIAYHQSIHYLRQKRKKRTNREWR